MESKALASAFDSIFHRLMPQAERVLLETNEHSRATPLVETRNARFIKSCQAVYPLHRYERLAPIMHRLRMIKQEAEVQMIRRACDITGEGFKRLLGFIKPGVGEWEIEAELLHEFVRSGSRGFAYTPIIGSGKNSCVLHYVKNDQVCREGELVLLDWEYAHRGHVLEDPAGLWVAATSPASTVAKSAAADPQLRDWLVRRADVASSHERFAVLAEARRVLDAQWEALAVAV